MSRADCSDAIHCSSGVRGLSREGFVLAPGVPAVAAAPLIVVAPVVVGPVVDGPRVVLGGTYMDFTRWSSRSTVKLAFKVNW